MLATFVFADKMAFNFVKIFVCMSLYSAASGIKQDPPLTTYGWAYEQTTSTPSIKEWQKVRNVMIKIKYTLMATALSTPFAKVSYAGMGGIIV